MLLKTSLKSHLQEVPRTHLQKKKQKKESCICGEDRHEERMPGDDVTVAAADLQAPITSWRWGKTQQTGDKRFLQLISPTRP